ncbi:MAG: ATP-binding protein [Elusimicrobia bacterium]|nr:ATP-binding protein [Elusimicrobiota bacterium]
MDSRSSGTTEARTLIRDLVNQFSDPLCFYRELVQNAVDGGANRIDVSLEFVADDAAQGASGRAIIRVEDDGEGMDERMIDEFLLVLFRSAKEGDLTKIGKFGIGFMSVFALKPDRVTLWTSKSGESWRLEFPDYSRYEKYRLDRPRDGTIVQLSVRMDSEAYRLLVDGSRASVRAWCRHADARIHFLDKTSGAPAEALSEPFDLASGASLRHREEGTEILLGFADEPRPRCGYYNRGLTLLECETAEESLRGLEFKINSRWLEHTMTRDNVLQDGNYRKAMAVVLRLAREEMPLRLREELEAAAAALSGRETTSSDPAAVEWTRRLTYLKTLFAGTVALWRNSDWRIFPTLSGPASLTDLKNSLRGGRTLLVDAARGRVTALLEKEGRPVLPSGPWAAAAAEWLECAVAVASDAFIAPEAIPDDGVSPEARGLLETLRALDARAASWFDTIAAGDLGYAGSCVKNELFVVLDRPGTLSPAPWDLRAAAARGKAALLNAAHPTAMRLSSLHASRPGLAGYLGLKLLYPPSTLSEAVEQSLLKAALGMER